MFTGIFTKNPAYGRQSISRSMRIVAQMPQEGGPRTPQNPIFWKNGKNHQQPKNSETSRSLVSTMFCWTKNTPKPIIFEKRKKISKTQKLKNVQKYAKISDLLFEQRSLIHWVSGWTKNTQNPDFFEKRIKSSKTQNSKMSRDLPKLAIRPSTRGL